MNKEIDAINQLTVLAGSIAKAMSRPDRPSVIVQPCGGSVPLLEVVVEREITDSPDDGFQYLRVHHERLPARFEFELAQDGSAGLGVKLKPACRYTWARMQSTWTDADVAAAAEAIWRAYDDEKEFQEARKKTLASTAVFRKMIKTLLPEVEAAGLRILEGQDCIYVAKSATTLEEARDLINRMAKRSRAEEEECVR